METLLIHKDLMETSFFDDISKMLIREGVTIYSGPNLRKYLTFGPPAAKSMKHEYGDLACCIEVVTDTDAAINHIHQYGSNHTEVIVTENGTFRQFSPKRI